MKLPNVSPEETLRALGLIARSYRAAVVATHPNGLPCLLWTYWTEQKFEHECRACLAAGYALAGLVALVPGGKAGLLVWERFASASVGDLESARNDFGLALMAEQFTPRRLTGLAARLWH